MLQAQRTFATERFKAEYVPEQTDCVLCFATSYQYLFPDLFKRLRSSGLVHTSVQLSVFSSAQNSANKNVPVPHFEAAYSLNYSHKTVNTMFSVLPSSLSWQVTCGWVLLVEKALFFTLISVRSQVFEHGPILVKIQKEISNLN